MPAVRKAKIQLQFPFCDCLPEYYEKFIELLAFGEYLMTSVVLRQIRGTANKEIGKSSCRAGGEA
jgi:hypothetical protein